MSACEVFNYRDEPFDTYGLSARQFYRIGKIVLMFLNVHLFLYILLFQDFYNMPGTISYCSVIEYTNK